VTRPSVESDQRATSDPDPANVSSTKARPFPSGGSRENHADDLAPDRATGIAGVCHRSFRSRRAAIVSMTAAVLSSAPYGLSDGWIWPKAG